ncbi:hypothetical protein SAMN05421595_0241 [Austwickia chelonae]|uniref:Uncharacterized protein n=1 Tax=Austwickia chelonae NBRC 105200 TaxID=1184607 RepID=K6W7D3_9MICO|nr:hypothetical protein [Austwickia chelonae]GAB77737.1 hypothetical protein AUCHE_06_00090 [Austwickia chelonae NBRC 105200]SEV88560.1 hypothetical protein SAMN05421595_0241 [Austwickia chelonae]
MKKNLGHITYALATVFCFLLGFTVLSIADRNIPLAERPTHVALGGGTKYSHDATFSEIARFVGEHRVTVGRHKEDLSTPEKNRDLFLLRPSQTGRTTPTWSTYPDVNRKMKTTVHQLETHQFEGWAGKYLIYGSPEKAELFAEAMRSQGFTAHMAPPSTAFLFFTQESGSLWSAVGILAALATTLVASQFSRSKSFGIMKLHGHTIGITLARDVRSAFRAAAISSALCAVVSVPLLRAYNGAAQFLTYLQLSITLGAIALALLTLVQATALVVVWKMTDLLNQLKGRLEGVPVIGVTYALRAPTAIMLIVLTITAAISGEELQRFTEQRSLWTETAARSGRLLFTGDGSTVVDADSEKKMVEKVGPWLERKAAAGEIYLALVVQASRGDTLDPEDVLIVDPAYHERHPTSTGGRTGKPSPGGEKTVDVALRDGHPEKTAPTAEALEHILQPILKEPPELTFPTRLPPDSLQFTYGAHSSSHGILPTTRASAVLTLSPENLRADTLVSAATSGGLLVKDPEKARKDIEDDPELSQVIHSVQPAGAHSAQRYEEAHRTFVFTAIGLTASALALTATSFGLVTAYATLRRQRTWVRKIHGWSFTRTYRRVLTTEAALWVALLLGFSWTARNRYLAAHSSALSDGSSPTQALAWAAAVPLSCGAALVVGFLSLVLMLLLLDRRINTHRLS